MDSLHDKVSRTILPEEYGGGAGSINDLWSKSPFYIVTCFTDYKAWIGIWIYLFTVYYSSILTYIKIRGFYTSTLPYIYMA
jgi:hypothetical protein